MLFDFSSVNVSALHGDELPGLSGRMLEIADAMYAKATIEVTKEEMTEFATILSDGYGPTPLIAKWVNETLDNPTP